jgi:RNA polymerase-binding transcription factor DksA
MTNKHKPEFIDEMKKALQEEKKQLENKLNSIAHKEGADYQANFPEYGRNDEDNATEIADYQATSSTENALEQRLHGIQNALERVDHNIYGITEDGKLIPEDRLRANPAAITTINQ